jgi:hypothetical protein
MEISYREKVPFNSEDSNDCKLKYARLALTPMATAQVAITMATKGTEEL